MSLSKVFGAAAGALVGLAIAALYAIGFHARDVMPATAIVATILLGILLGAGIGASIGSADRRLR